MKNFPPTKVRSLSITLLGWLVIVVGGILSTISLVSLLMILAGSEGTRSMEVTGIMLVVVFPPLSVIVGIGLLRHHRWAWFSMVIGLIVLISCAGTKIFRPSPTPVTIYVSPSGVKNTIYRSSSRGFWGGVAILALGLVCFLATPKVRRTFRAVRQSNSAGRPDDSSQLSPPSDTPFEGGTEWRVGHRGRDMMFYEERHGESWHRLDIDGEMLIGRPHHAIYLPTEEAWQTFPEWTRDRREEIVARIMSEFRESDYEYIPYSYPKVAGQAAAPVPGSPSSPPERVTGKQWAAMITVILLAVGLAVWMGLLSTRGLTSEELPFPSTKPTLRRQVDRKTEPVTFWLCFGVYSGVGMCAFGGAAWFFVQGIRCLRIDSRR